VCVQIGFWSGLCHFETWMHKASHRHRTNGQICRYQVL